MNVPDAVRAALRAAGLCDDVRSTRELSGGCIHRVLEVELADGTVVVAKLNCATALALFQEEARSLDALTATKTVVVPRPLAVINSDGHAVLLMTCIECGSADAGVWTAFGHDLAALHAVSAGARYGFDADNHVGSTLQPNAWMNDWVEFNAVNRLGYQLELAREHHRLEACESDHVETVIARLDQFIPRTPRPSLLHGDLWSGNVIPTTANQRPTFAVIDPACSIGHALADIAMMQLFGGFAPECFRAYEQASGVRLGDEERRAAIAVYQLYHVLNHVNLFGSGYIGQALALARQLGT